MTEIRIALDRLYYGHEATPPINARKVGREDDIESLAASIAAHGLGQALNVKAIDGAFYVADGNRRLAALRFNVGRGIIPQDLEIACREVDGAADELSLALNVQRVAMHEADQYEKFHELHAGGMSAGQIGARFGIEPKRVARLLALGALSPVILEAWREDKLGRDPGDVVRAFTLAPSLADQERVFKKLTKSGHLWPHIVRQELGASDHDAARNFKFVGLEAYVAAGGTVIEDLFGDQHVISDAKLVARLATEKLEAKVAELKAEGWSWVEMASDLPYSWTYGWEKLKAGKKKVTAEQKAKAGCVIAFGGDGTLNITYGVMKPAATKAAKAKTKAKDEPEAAPAISNALMDRLSVQLTAAAKGAIVDHPHTALAALVAGMACANHHGAPVRLRADGLLPESREPEGFLSVFQGLLAKSDAALMAAAAHEVSFCLNMHSYSSAQPPLADKVYAAFCEALDEDSSLQAELMSKFDAEDYFKTVSRPFAITAIAEALNEEEARKAGKLKKAELVAFAVANVVPTGWLPPELRTSGYVGPRKELAQKAA